MLAVSHTGFMMQLQSFLSRFCNETTQIKRTRPKNTGLFVYRLKYLKQDQNKETNDLNILNFLRVDPLIENDDSHLPKALL